MTFPPSPSPSVPRDSAALQARIDAVRWYHEFDFGGGLEAQSAVENLSGLREVWRYIERSLAAIAFTGKTVLDVGAWDGFWSFVRRAPARRRIGAGDRRCDAELVGGRGPDARARAARVTRRSRQDLPIYELASLRRTFDVILCLGVFYDLRDPLYGFAQLRHCCHPGTVVVIEGELLGVERRARARGALLLQLVARSSCRRRRCCAGCCSWRIWTSSRWYGCIRFPTEPSPDAALQSDRAFLVCRPFAGVNDMYRYRPHFGLHAYDTRWS